MPRLFAGIELPESIRDHLSDLQRPLPGAKWVDLDDLHITLRFAGDIEGRPMREFGELLGEIEVDAFELRLDQLGSFGGNEPRAIWAGIAPSPQLDALARACDRAARNAGLPPAQHPFKAHVTLARLRNTPPELVARYFERIGAFRSEPFVVEEFVLFSSKPKVGGGPYVVEAAYPLRNAYYGVADDDRDDRRT
jgi:RNA 2',3'-cyclic 3'-phosphodiesterase